MIHRSKDGAKPLYRRFPRKLKKKLKKIDPRLMDYSEYMWRYKRPIVDIRNARVLRNYPRLSTNEELFEWYSKHYPENKEKLQLCFSKKTLIEY